VKKICPTARIPLIPALMRAGAITNPPPAPMHPVMRPAMIPIRIEAIKIPVE